MKFKHLIHLFAFSCTFFILNSMFGFQIKDFENIRTSITFALVVYYWLYIGVYIMSFLNKMKKYYIVKFNI